MSDQTIISPVGQPAPTIETALGSVGPDDILSCEFLASIQKWSCKTWRPGNRDPELYGIGTTLVAALADLHPAQFLKRARDAGLQEWATEDEPE